MRRTCDVENECILAHHADERRITLGRIGQRMQQRTIGVRISLMHMHMRMQRARRGKRHPRHQAQRMGLFIARDKHYTAALPRDDEGGRVIRRGGRA